MHVLRHSQTVSKHPVGDEIAKHAVLTNQGLRVRLCGGSFPNCNARLGPIPKEGIQYSMKSLEPLWLILSLHSLGLL